jgi:1-acyl-sn-glycerol-3-phosphate acyltransferase
MIELGYKHIKIFKKTFFHPFITLKPAYRQLSLDRQAYSNKVLDFLNIDVKIVGELPQKNNILYAINHRSLLDIIVMENVFSRYNKSGTWIAKQELFESIIYGKFFEYSGCISVDLESKKGLISFFKTIKKTFNRVDDINLYIFPEGERFDGEGFTKFQGGAAIIAKSNKLDIVPIFINEKMEEVFENAPFAKKISVEVNIGKVISYKNLEAEYTAFVDKIKKVK